MNFMEIKKKTVFLCQKKGKKLIQFWNSLYFFLCKKQRHLHKKKCNEILGNLGK